MPPPTSPFKKKVILYVTIDEDLKFLLQRLADDNRRSLASVTQIVLGKGLGLDPIHSLYMREDTTDL